MSKLVITLTRSYIRKSPAQKKCLRSLGLNYVGHTLTKTNNSSILGMVKKVKHLVTVTEQL